MPPKYLPLANIGHISDALRAEIILIENNNIINITTKRDMRMNVNKERDVIIMDKEMPSIINMEVEISDKKRPRFEEELSETNKKVDNCVPIKDITNYPNLRSTINTEDQDTTA